MKHTRALSAHKIAFAVAILWTILIAMVCLMSFEKLPSVKVKGADKIVHVTLHFVFTIVWFLYLNKGNPITRLMLRIFTASFCYGIAIEIMQEIFTISRRADIFDVIANSVGAFMAIIAVNMFEVLKHKKISN